MDHRSDIVAIPQGLLLPVAVHEDNGIVDGKDELKYGGNGVCGNRYALEQGIGAHVDGHSHANGGKEYGWLEPRLAHDDEHNKQQDKGGEYHAYRCRSAVLTFLYDNLMAVFVRNLIGNLLLAPLTAA